MALGIDWGLPLNTDPFIALIVPTIAWLLAVALYMIGSFRNHRPAQIMAVGYLSFGTGMFVLYFAPFGFIFSRLLANCFILLGIAVTGHALLSRRKEGMPRLPIALAIAATLISLGWALTNDVELGPRVIVASIGIAAITLIFASRYLRVRDRSRLDNIIIIVALGLTAASLSRPFTFYMWPPQNAGAEESLFQSVYWVGVMLSAVFFLTAAALTMIAAVGLEAIEELRLESSTDGLTGILNRRGFEHGANRLIRQAGRQGLPVSLILCDLDHFKEINDRHGHACGDRVIVAFARCLAGAVGSRHLVGRVGGEEFAVLLYGVNAAAARLTAEGLRVEFAELEFHAMPDGQFTASFGVAEMHDDDLDSLTSRADAALYAAKAAGRNRVRMAAQEASAETATPLRPAPGQNLLF